MAGTVAAAAAMWLDHVFCNQAWAGVGDAAGLLASTGSGSLYISAHTADPVAGNQSTSEIAYTGYARISLARTSTNFTVSTNTVALAAIGSWGAMAGGAGGTITHFGVGTSATGAGQLLWCGTVTPNIAVSVPIEPKAAAGVFLTLT